MKKKLVLAMAAIFVLSATAVPAFASATAEKCAPVCMSEFVDADAGF